MLSIEIKIDLEEGIKFCRDICHGMAYLHSLDPPIKRFDLNPHHVFVSISFLLLLTHTHSHAHTHSPISILSVDCNYVICIVYSLSFSFRLMRT